MSQLLEIKGGEQLWAPIVLKEKSSDLTLKVGDHAKVTFVEVLEAGSDLNQRRIVEAGPYSQVRFIRLQILPKEVHLDEKLTSQIHEGAAVHFFNFHFGASDVKSEMTHFTEGFSARCDMDLVTEARGNQLFDFHLKNHYRKKQGLGAITAKGVAKDQSTLGINGAIVIEQTGGGTDAHLNQAILNLSPNTRVKAVPALEIDTNDVKAAHSASVTNLNEETLFYMTSRGLHEAAAKKMLTEGFLKESIDKLADLPDIQERIYHYL